MIAFDLQALREGVAEVLSAECGSREVHAFVDGASALDDKLWRQAASLGWLGIGLPEELGGLGLGAAGLDVLHTELGRRVAPGPFIATLSAAQWLAEAGRGEWAGKVAAGELKIAVPAAAGSDLLLGSADSGLAVIRTPDGFALVEPGQGALVPEPMWDRTRAACVLRGEARTVATIEAAAGRSLDRWMSLAVAADSIGAGEAIAGQTVEYMKARVQFGKPIGSFQALKHRAADQAISLAANRHLVAQAVEAADAPPGDLWAAIAKASATDAFKEVAADCVQLHGGIGHTWEYDCHLYVKRARLNEMLVASNAARRDFAAAELAAVTRAGGTVAELAA